MNKIDKEILNDGSSIKDGKLIIHDRIVRIKNPIYKKIIKNKINLNLSKIHDYLSIEKKLINSPFQTERKIRKLNFKSPNIFRKRENHFYNIQKQDYYEMPNHSLVLQNDVKFSSNDERSNRSLKEFEYRKDNSHIDLINYHSNKNKG